MKIQNNIENIFDAVENNYKKIKYIFEILGRLRYGDYGLRTTAGRALSIFCSTGLSLASHEGVFRGARFVGRDEKLAPLKTPAWEARLSRVNKER